MCGDGARLEDDEERYTGVMPLRPDTCNEDSYLRSGRPSSLFRTSFSSARLESLYRASSLQQRRGGLQCFLMSAILYGIYTIASPDPEAPSRSLTAVFLSLNLGLLAWAKHGAWNKDTQSAWTWTAAPYFVWQLCTAELLLQLFVKNTDVTPRDGLGWLLLFLYLLFATLPLRLSHCVFLACGTALTYTCIVVGLSRAPDQIPYDVLVSDEVADSRRASRPGRRGRLGRASREGRPLTERGRDGAQENRTASPSSWFDSNEHCRPEGSLLRREGDS